MSGRRGETGRSLPDLRKSAAGVARKAKKEYNSYDFMGREHSLWTICIRAYRN
jgi:hypothetical protein